MRQLDLSAIFKIILSKIVPILLSGLILAALVFGYNAFFVSPLYSTTTTILVNNGGLANVGVSGENVSSTDLSASLTLVETCVDILESDNMYKELSTALGGKLSYVALKNRFSAAPRGEESLLIDITTFGGDPDETRQTANTFLEVAPTFIKNNIISVDVKILATADNYTKVSPHPVSSALTAFLLGAVISSAVFVLIALSKNTVESEKDFKERYDVPLLGCVPIFENKQVRGKRNEKVK